MFQYITGDVKGIYDNYIVLENNGIGYKIFTSLSTIRKLKINENFLINVKYVVREDSVSLYGFYSNEELDMFDLLTKVSSVGPKNAMSILSTLSLSELQKAIVNNDVKGQSQGLPLHFITPKTQYLKTTQIGRASCRERV